MFSLSDADGSPVDLERRAKTLFHNHRRELAASTDRMFALLMVMQWAAGIVAALVISPQTWSGSIPSVHVHVWSALIGGGLLSGLPIFLALRHPGQPSTRYTIAVGQMLWSALLIHLTGGRIETHFHIFGSLAFIAFYRDWRVLIPATIVVAADHAIRGVFWPQSVYGVLTASPWRTVEHAAWVIFEDVFLIHSCRMGAAEMWDIAKQRVRLQQAKELTELEVQDRTEELESTNESLEYEVAERRRVEEELQQAKDAAEDANMAKSEFLANMSHEIRTPMTAILGFAENMLEADQPQEEKLNCAHTIRRNGEYLLDLINGILDLSKIEAGKMTVERESSHPCRIIAEAAALMRGRAEAKGLPFDIEYNGAIPQTIQSDPTRLRQILINLIGNAVKFTETGSVRLVIRFVEDGHDPRMQFDVIDTGCGMTEEQKAKLFLPFMQADTSTTRKFGGTGLGLTISKRFAELLGGEVIVAATEKGVGSTFRCTVATGPLDGVKMLDDPMSATVVAVEAIVVTQAPRSDLQGCRILLAEDGPDNQRLIAFILKKAGADVTVEENGKLALDAVLAARDEGNPFDVILMDMQMPVMDGYEATGRLRHKGYTGPIIALTAHAMAGDREKCINAGCDGYATKPVDRKRLIETIEAHLRVATV